MRMISRTDFLSNVEYNISVNSLTSHDGRCNRLMRELRVSCILIGWEDTRELFLLAGKIGDG
jgi:hypothetical protein